MTEPKSFLLSTELHRYLVDHGTPPDPILTRLNRETAGLGDVAIMQVAPEQGTFLELLAHATQARFAVELGTFTGYSALCIARGLAPRGRLLCCDVSEEWTAIARRYWAEAGVDDRIDLRIGPALDTLRSLPRDQPVDLAFVDADKPGYLDYYEELLPRLSPHGLLVVDNVLWDGRAAAPPTEDDDESTRAIRAFNDHVAADPRSRAVMLPISDGLTVLRRV